MSKRISRAEFLKAALATAAVLGAGEIVWSQGTQRKRIPCRMLGPSMAVGHMLRDGSLRPPADLAAQPVKVAIVGGGIAGLSAAWRLKKRGCKDVVLLELEPEVGGNSRSGRNAVSQFPWGAHYVPLANDEAQYVHELFQELGIITGYGTNGLPVYNELYLCHEPQERLLKDGVFQEGMVPRRGLQPDDKRQIGRFFDLMSAFRQTVGLDQRPAFAIPVDLSSTDPKLRALDEASFKTWCDNNDFTSRPLLWYLNYCCRDDYGATIENVSAWAGLHYFAGRRGKAANAETNSVVTWPEGNGFLVNQLRSRVSDVIRVGNVVTSVQPSDRSALVTTFEPGSRQWHAFEARHVIMATPRFVAERIVHHADNQPLAIQYAPWLVANVTVTQVPAGKGVELSWDNVSYNSHSLGYVDANHQNITTRTGSRVLTYYFPLSDQTPMVARQNLYASTAESWSNRIVADLESMHPGISEFIQSIDLWPWGHGMVSPAVGFVWGSERQRMKQSVGPIRFAHSDMSGMSNFEEAQYHGVSAAQAILEELEGA